VQEKLAVVVLVDVRVRNLIHFLEQEDEVVDALGLTH
jgi:hypothetical protein